MTHVRDDGPAPVHTAVVPPALPLDRPRPVDRDVAAVAAPITLSAQQLRAIATHSEQSTVDDEIIALALFATLLHRYDGGGTISFATPVSHHDPTPHVVTVPFEPGATFAGTVRDTRDAVVRARRSPGRTTRETPVFTRRSSPEVGGATTDLALHLAGDGTGRVVMAADVFTVDTAVRFAGHLARLLEGAAADPTRAVAELPLLTSAEEAAFAATAGEDLPASAPFPLAFRRQVTRTPDAVAVRTAAGTLTYAELDRAANVLAHLLRASGVCPEVRVGLSLDPGPGLAVAVLAVLKAGGAYVPLDPRDPLARRVDMVADAGARVVLTEQPLSLPGVTVIDLNAVEDATRPGEPPDVTPAPTDAAYVLYTSGSTGRPKGVVVEHRHLMSYVDGVVARLGIDRPLRFAMVQPLTVDSSVTAFFPPLCTGGEVHLLSRERVLDAERLAEWTTTHGVDVLKIAPSHLRALQSSPRFPDLLPRELLVVGGEAADWRWLRDLQAAVPRCRVHNHYGPTETTVGVLTLAVADHPDADWDIAPIGLPLPGVRIDVVDAAGQPVPVGVVGELVIHGATVARGYHNRPELTDAAFGPDRTRYRTGDHVRRLADGTVAFVGRRDDQVKVRGFRVEPGEITAALCDHPAVRAAVTVVRTDLPGDRAVVSYVEPHLSPHPEPAELLAHLRSRVAPHMVPRAVVVLDRLPLSPHGKVDRVALPPPPRAPSVREAGPESELEHVVAEAWQQVLRVGTVGVDVNFFDSGGHSLLLVDLQQRLRAALRREVDLLDLLAHTTVRAQARLLADSGRPAAPEVAARPRTPQQVALLRRRVQQRHARRERDG